MDNIEPFKGTHPIEQFKRFRHSKESQLPSKQDNDQKQALSSIKLDKQLVKHAFPLRPRDPKRNDSRKK